MFFLDFNKIEVKNSHFSKKYEFYEKFIIESNHDLSKFYSSKFKLFFKDLCINTPKSLNSIKSIKRFRGLTNLKTFSRYLVRHGKKVYFNKILLNSFFYVFKNSTNFNLNWKFFFINFSNILKKSNSKTLLSPNLSKTDFSNIEELGFNNYCAMSFKKLNLIYSFYIYKIDKHIYKNSRGKSGKFTFVWKYIPFYKRISRLVYWLIKDVRVSQGKTLQSRMNLVLNTFFNNPQKSIVWRIKKFSLNYVYFNLRKSLLETFNTSLR